MKNKIEVYVERKLYSQKFAFTMIGKSNNNVAVAEPLVFSTIENGQQTNPSFELDYDDAQMFIDELYRQGLRPSDVHQTAGEKEALQGNITDLRKILDAVVNGFSTKRQND